MPTRQYIGARYVPKIFNNNGSNAWVSGIAYEALTIVTYLNNSYTSIKPVPSNAGAPNVATEYWACTGDFTGYVNALTEEMNVIEGDITAINTRLGNIRDKKYIFCGDSYATNDDTKWGTGWIDKVVTQLGLTPNVNAFDSRGLATYYGGSFAGGNFRDQLQQIYGAHEDVADDITDIFCFAGTNEVVFTATQINTGISNFCSYAREHFPNAKIHIGFVGGRSDTTNWADFLMALQCYRKCGNYGAGYVANIEYVNTKYNDFTADKLHPNDMSELATYIASGIVNGCVDFKKSYQIADKDANGCVLNIGIHNGYLFWNFVIPNTVITENLAYGYTTASAANMTLYADFQRLPILRHTVCKQQTVTMNPNNTWDSMTLNVRLDPDGKLYLQINNYGHASQGAIAQGTSIMYDPNINKVEPWDYTQQ